MKIIKVGSCGDCPHYKYESPNCGNDYVYCDKSGVTLAKERKVITKESIISPITCTVTPQVEEWKFICEDDTIWDSSTIPKWCPLSDEIVDNNFYKDWLIDLRNELYKQIEYNRLAYEIDNEKSYKIKEEQLRELARLVISVTGD